MGTFVVTENQIQLQPMITNMLWLTICRYSYSCVVKRPDFQKHFDCSGVQSYKTNNNRVLYIKQKRAIQQVKEDQINTKKVCCIVCNLTIIDEDYCSIECKLARLSSSRLNSLKVDKTESRRGYKTAYSDGHCLDQESKTCLGSQQYFGGSYEAAAHKGGG